MILAGGVPGLLWSEFVTLMSRLFRTVMLWSTAVYEGTVHSLRNLSSVVFRSLLGVLWGRILFGVLLGISVVLSALGVQNVHAVLLRKFDSTDTDETDTAEPLPDVSPEAVTDTKGRFSPSTFERVTGMQPAAFVHVFVKSKGGRVRQQTINACLPWSKTTVSRLLDTLEEEGLVVRVSTGRENVVCTPAEAPETET